MTVMTILRRRRQPSSSLPEDKRILEDEHERDDEGARKRAELEVLRRIRQVGWWWPDGS